VRGTQVNHRKQKKAEIFMSLLSRLLASALVTLGLCNPTFAQDYPNRPITWIVPFAAGGVTDNAARFLSKGLGERLGQTVVVENKPGAGGIVGSEYVANSKPDGYTFLYASSGPMTTIPATRKTLSYDPIKSFTPLYGMAVSPLVLVIAPDKPYKTFAEFVEYAKRNPGKLNFASIGTAAAQHLTGEIFALGTNTDVVHIPYKATPVALTDIMSGTIDFMFEFQVVLKPLIESGKLRALATTATQRLPGLPDVPTTAELGYPQITFNPWGTVVMPKDVPKPVADKFIAAFAEVMKDPATVEYFEKNGSQVLPPLPGEKLREFLVSESAKMKAIVEKAKIPIE
jgi:tripartite-type tricarboxylate transporter receptor subunit TctC